MPLFLSDKTNKEHKRKGGKGKPAVWKPLHRQMLYISTHTYMIGKFSSPKRCSQPGRDLACLGNSQTVLFHSHLQNIHRYVDKYNTDQKDTYISYGH